MNEYSVTIKFRTSVGKIETRTSTVRAYTLDGAMATMKAAYAGFDIIEVSGYFVREL